MTTVGGKLTGLTIMIPETESPVRIAGKDLSLVLFLIIIVDENITACDNSRMSETANRVNVRGMV